MALLSVLQGEGGRGGGLADAALATHDDETLVSLGCRVGERRALPQPSPKYWSAGTPLTSKSRKGDLSCSSDASDGSPSSISIALS